MFKKITAVFLGFVAGFAGLMSSAHAALDPAIATAFDAVKADATSLNAIVLPIVISIMGMLLVYKLIKKFGNKI
jgi:hypothetical protein